jgi:hypothetical protein
MNRDFGSRIVLIVLVGSMLFVTAQGCMKGTGKRNSDPDFRAWEDSTISATGRAPLENPAVFDAAERLITLQAAKADVFAKLKEKILDISIDSTKKVSDMITDHPDSLKKLDSYVRTARLVSTRYVAGSGFEVEAEIYLGARFKNILGIKPREIPTQKSQNKPLEEPAIGSSYRYPSSGNP